MSYFRRVIPTVLIREGSAVKTKQFRKPQYIGDPENAVRIFSELEADELIILNIEHRPEGVSESDLNMLCRLSEECFMPLTYGGGIRSGEDADRLFEVGIEKIILNTTAFMREQVVSDIASKYGSQAVVASIDVRGSWKRGCSIYTDHGKRRVREDLGTCIKRLIDLGAGEIMLTSIDREGCWSGLDRELIKAACTYSSVPVVGHGGACSAEDIIDTFRETGCSGIATGSLVSFQKQGMGVLLDLPEELKFLNI